MSCSSSDPVVSSKSSRRVNDRWMAHRHRSKPHVWPSKDLCMGSLLQGCSVFHIQRLRQQQRSDLLSYLCIYCILVYLFPTDFSGLSESDSYHNFILISARYHSLKLYSVQSLGSTTRWVLFVVTWRQISNIQQYTSSAHLLLFFRWIKSDA